MISSSSSSNLKQSSSSSSGQLSARDHLKQLMKKQQGDFPADASTLNKTYGQAGSPQIHQQQLQANPQQYLVTKGMPNSNYTSNQISQKSSRQGFATTQSPPSTSNGSYTSPLRNNINSSNSYTGQNTNNIQASPTSARSAKMQDPRAGIESSSFNNFIDLNSFERKSSTGRLSGAMGVDSQDQAQYSNHKSATLTSKTSNKASTSNKMQQMLKELVGNTSNGSASDRHLLNSSYGSAVPSEAYKTALNRTEQISSRHEVSSIRSRENSSERMKSPSNQQATTLQSYSSRMVIQQQIQNVSPLRSPARPISGGTCPATEMISSRPFYSNSQNLNNSSKALQIQQYSDASIASSQSSSSKAKQSQFSNSSSSQNLMNRSNSKPRLADHLIEATYNSNSRSLTPKQQGVSQRNSATPTNKLTQKQQESPNFGGGGASLHSSNSANNVSSAINSVLQYQQKAQQLTKRAIEETVKGTTQFNASTPKNSLQGNTNIDVQLLAELQAQQSAIRKNPSQPINSQQSSAMGSHRDSLAQHKDYPRTSTNNSSGLISKESQRSTTPIGSATNKSIQQGNKQFFGGNTATPTSQLDKRSPSPIESRSSTNAIASGSTLKKVGTYATSQSEVLRAIQEQQRIKQEHFGHQGSQKLSEQPTRQKNKPSADFFESNYFQFNPDVIEQLKQEQHYSVGGTNVQGQGSYSDSQSPSSQFSNTAQRQMNKTSGFLSNESGPSSRHEDENDSELALKQFSSDSQSSKKSNSGKSSLNKNRGTGQTNNSMKQKLAMQQTESEFLDSTSTATNYSEELSKSTLAKINLKDILSIESNLYELQKNGFTSKAVVTKYCKNYLHIIAEQQVDTLEKICSDTRQCSILTRMFVLERICIMLSLNQALKRSSSNGLESCDNMDDEDSDDDGSVEQIKNTVQYVHLNFLLFIDVVVSKYSFTPEQRDMEYKVRQLFETRMKVKRFSSSLSKSDKFQVISNYCDIILPYLKNVVQNYNKEPFLSVAKIIRNISTATVSQTTQILMDSFARIIVELEERASKESYRSSVDSAYSSSSTKKNEITSNKQNEISFEQMPKRPLTSNAHNKSTLEIPTQSDLKKSPSAKPQINAQSQKAESLHKREDESEEEEEDETEELDDEDEDEEDYNQGYEMRGSIPAPYLPVQQKGSKPYTLVLDLDETLVHYEEVSPSGGQFLIRPNAEKFLQIMAKSYEIVIFTAAVKEYADFILDVIDEGSISFRLYRQHTDSDGRSFVKDISKLGRDLSKTIIIDNLPENFSRQPKNGILISSWMGEADDRALIDLVPLLSCTEQNNQMIGRWEVEIPTSKKFGDVRDALQKYREQMMKNLINGVQDPHIHLILDQID